MKDKERKERLSNMELLRLVAMFMVLALHANFYPLRPPSAFDVCHHPLNAFTRTLLESLAIVSVNAFVLLSGWFGIHPRWKSFLSLLFQCLFFSVGLWAAGLAAGGVEWSWVPFRNALTLRDYWFVQSYIVLYLLAPALNHFAKSAPRRVQAVALAACFAFEALTSFFTDACPFLSHGYSVWAFCPLYLLARHLRAFPCRPMAWPASVHFTLYAALMAANAALAFSAARHTGHSVSERLFFYTNPLVVGGALFLLLGFSRLNFKSRAVNTLAASALAIYLFHTAAWMSEGFFLPSVRKIYERFSGEAYFSVILLFLIAVAGASIAADRVRISLWRRLLKTLTPNSKTRP